MRGQKPNILFIMADQLAPQALPIHGNPVVKAPNISSLANQGVTFDNAYCNSPLCGPSRASMLTSRLGSSIGAYDNSTEYSSEIPTLLHYLRHMDYKTILSGKMHFVGADQLHGFEERLTTDIYPSDFGWTPNWKEGEFNKPAGASPRGVIEAGKCYRNLQIDYDDEVEFKAIQKLYDLARDQNSEPFFLCASFSNPHHPFHITPEYWNRYNHDEINMPTVPNIPLKEMDAFSRWIQIAHGVDQYDITEGHIRNARHAYYGMISYIDDKVGHLLEALKRCDFSDNTVVLFASDHGEMMGERGMWYKQSFFEWSSRVSLIFNNPHFFSEKRIREVVSLVDLFPTVLDIAADGDMPELAAPIEGHSMMNLMCEGDPEWNNTAISEYLAEGVRGPCEMIRKGRYKYIYTDCNPGMMFDLENDPNELHNIVEDPGVKDIKDTMLKELMDKTCPAETKEQVLKSQKSRLFIDDVLENGSQPKWDFQANTDDTKRFLRSGGSPNEVKAKMRLPRVDSEKQRYL